MKRILITGASGMLGKDIVKVFRGDKEYNVFGITKREIAKEKGIHYVKVDLREISKLKKELKRIKPEIIIHCAALVDIDYCEKNKNEANALHYGVSGILSGYNALRTKFIYISTDSVFDGVRGNYTEEDVAHPLNYYAKSKLKGENVSITNNTNSLIIRTNIYGFHVPLGNSLAEWALDNLMKKKRIGGFTDVFFNPVYTKQLARVIKFIVESNRTIKGILNVGSETRISKYVFLTKLAKAFKKGVRTIDPICADSVSFKAKRPKDTFLDVGKLQKIIKKIPDLDDGLKELHKDYNSLIRTTNS